MLLPAVIICMSSCASSNFPTSESGVIQAQNSTMDKDAVRVKVKVLSRTKLAERMSYQAEVLEVVGLGDTFATVEPTSNDVVTIYTPLEVKFKKNDEVLLDALSPINRGEVLVLNMVVD